MKNLLEEFNNPPMKVWAVTTALVVLFAVVPSTSFHLDDNSVEHSAAKDAIAQQQREQRFANAGKAMCGDNAAWVTVDENTIQCLTHKGRKTIQAKVTP